MNESASFFQICSLLNAKREVIVKYPSEVILLNRISVCIFLLVLMIPTVTLNGVSVITIIMEMPPTEREDFLFLVDDSISYLFDCWFG